MEETKYEEIKNCIYDQLKRPCSVCLDDMDYQSDGICIFISNRQLCAYILPLWSGSLLNDCWFDENGKTIKNENESRREKALNIRIQHDYLIEKWDEKYRGKGCYSNTISPFINDTFISSINSDNGHPNLAILNDQFDILYKIPLPKGRGYGEFNQDISYIAYDSGLLAIKVGFLVYILPLLV